MTQKNCEALHVRALLASDIDALLAIQADAYPCLLHESAAVFSARVARCPETVWLAEDDAGALGYLVGYRSQVGAISALGDDFSPCKDGNSLYLHDLAVNVRARGRGVAQRLLAAAEAQARALGAAYLTLVAVLDAEGYWRKRGFTPVADLTAEQQQLLASYGERAVYMVRHLVYGASLS